MEIPDIRQKIDEIDASILELLNERARLVVRIGQIKEASASSVFDPKREIDVLKRILQRNEGPLPPESVRSIYREIISCMRSLEKPLTVAYWGPPATNTHLASIRKFGSSTEFTPQDTITDVFGEVQRGRADFGVVPIENSIEGIVNHTLDMFLRSDLKICSEVYLQISHCLLSKCETLADVKRIYSIPVATAQCRRWLTANMRQIEMIDASTTAKAAMQAADDPGSAAIASEVAAEVYGLNVLADHIEDNPANRTRFLVVGHVEPRPSGKDKTSMVFSVPHQAGSLFKALSIFNDCQINLTLIESRPTKLLPWEYVFYVDAQGHVSEPAMAEAVERLKAIASFVTVLGSYPEAE